MTRELQSAYTDDVCNFLRPQAIHFKVSRQIVDYYQIGLILAPKGEDVNLLPRAQRLERIAGHFHSGGWWSRQPVQSDTKHSWRRRRFYLAQTMTTIAHNRTIILIGLLIHVAKAGHPNSPTKHIHRVSKNCANLFFAPCLSNMNRFQ